MRDYLIDIIKHTVPLGAFETLRIDGSDDATEITASAGDNHLILLGKLHAMVPEFKGLFGLPNLPLLNVLLSIPEYQDEAAKSSVTREVKDGVEQPSYINLENGSGDFKNSFRLMATRLVDSVRPKLQFNVKSWPVEFVPSVAAQQRLKFQSQANPEEKVVTFKIEKGTITAQMGDASSHSGSFVLHNGIDKNIKITITAPITHVNSVLSLSGDKIMHMGDLGTMISVDSGLANYDFIMPHMGK